MAKALYKTVEGPNGRAEIYEVTHDLPPDPWALERLELARVLVVVYEVRSCGRWQASCVDEEEAAALAAALAGVPFGPPTSVGRD